MYDCFSPPPLLPGVMHELSQLCGDIEDGGTKHAAVLVKSVEQVNSNHNYMLLRQYHDHKIVLKKFPLMQGYRNLSSN